MSLKEDPSVFRIPIHTKFPATDYSEQLAWATAWVRAIHPAGPAPVYVRKRKPKAAAQVASRVVLEGISKLDCLAKDLPSFDEIDIRQFMIPPKE